MALTQNKITDELVAYQLLVELLVHQFAFPVQWVDTQNSLLSGQNAITRLVELGPSTTLVDMAKKTLERDGAGMQSHQTTQLLASTRHSEELLYRYEPLVPLSAKPADDGDKDILPKTKSSSVSEKKPPLPRRNTAAPALAASDIVKDVAITSTDVVRIMVARKLKVPISEVPPSKSIKELCGGKSTLQNELIGDLENEFGALPNRPEDVPVQKFSSQIIIDPDRLLGKTSSTLVTRLVALKMPAGHGVDSIRRYLADRWGLGPIRQSAVLLCAAAAEPHARLTSIPAAEEYWNHVVASYGALSGVPLQIWVPAQDKELSAQPTKLIDPLDQPELSRSQKRMALKQYQALVEYLGSDLPNITAAPMDSDSLISELQQQLDTWTAEFTPNFLPGVTPVFHAEKVRSYSSWWNNARQELMAYYHGDESDELFPQHADADVFARRLCAKADDALATLACNLTLSTGRHNLLNGNNALSGLPKTIQSAANKAPTVCPLLPTNRPRTQVTVDGDIVYSEVPREGFSGTTAYTDFLSRNVLGGDNNQFAIRIEHNHMSDGGTRTPASDMTARYIQCISSILENGISFTGKTVLITGAGEGSIGREIICLLLAGGACVIATTSREPSTVASDFQRMYETHGAKDSELHLVQFNQASSQDCGRLIDHIYNPAQGTRKDLDAIIPFAAAPEEGTEMDSLSAENELVHRMMLVNVFRLLGNVVKHKRDQGIDCKPTQVLLPLSPNKGIFGGDGLYPESKVGLETLLQRVKSESWSQYLSICGLEIGWTRSTGLMTANDIVAEAVESYGVLTFSAQQMALNIIAFLAPEFVSLCEDGPVHACFGGGLDAIENCHEVLSNARRVLKGRADIARAIKMENDFENSVIKGTVPLTPPKKKTILRVGFPHIPCDVVADRGISNLKNLANTVVVVGFSELGPWGSSRLRWQIESSGRLSAEGYVEMAWLMGLIQYHDGPRQGGYYVGWVDSKTKEPVADSDMEQTYGDHIKAHAGIRFVEPEVSSTGYDPLKKDLLHEVAIEDDLPAFQTSIATAKDLKRKHGDKVSLSLIEGKADTCRVQIKAGAIIHVPKAVQCPSTSVAGQLPTGWDPARYGIPEDIIHQVDPVTLYTICCVAEAFYSAGITDIMEIYQHMHLSEFGNYIGSSMGGALKTRQLYRDAYLDQEIQADTLQDTYLNTTAAWVNMLLLGATGPIKTPVGACATGVESIDSGFESITSGKTKMCLVGGYDDLLEEEAIGFSRMKATVDVSAEIEKGRAPSEMSRPTAESRAGFVESHGCGVQLLCRGDVALEMGLPIYGVIAGCTMAADKIGRSVPAPGQGILGFARESREGVDKVHLGHPTSEPSGHTEDAMAAGPSTSPLRASLASWGLSIDDLDVASLHATSTRSNDINEPDVIHAQMSHLGRTEGIPLWAICQKSITGHPKAPAAAWMLNGCLQVLDSGLIPGNRNADSIDPALRSKHHLCFPTRTVQTAMTSGTAASSGPRSGLKAFLLTSFGFGQKSGQIVGVAPRFFFALMDGQELDDYRSKTKARTARADRAYVKALMSNSIVKVQKRPQYSEADAARIFLDPLARISHDAITGSYRYDSEDIRNTRGKR